MKKLNDNLMQTFAKTYSFLRQTILLLPAIALLPMSVHALGFRIPNQDAEATAKGNAFVATADNPSAIYYNPAGITQLEGTHAQFGLHNLSVNSRRSTARRPWAQSVARSFAFRRPR